jgi:hypothetical protein
MIEGLEKVLSQLPKGVIRKRKKLYKGKAYHYYYLKYREGNKVINKHISNKEHPEIIKKLNLRKQYEKEIKSCKKRILYLKKVLGT